MILLQFPHCTPILTFAPPFWHLTPSWKKRLFWRGKIKKKSPKFFLRLRDTYKKYILQKNWSKTAIPALSSGPSNLQQSIWGRHHQLDDQHRNPNMNNKDHLVGQLTKLDLERGWLLSWHPSNYEGFVSKSYFQISESAKKRTKPWVPIDIDVRIVSAP